MTYQQNGAAIRNRGMHHRKKNRCMGVVNKAAPNTDPESIPGKNLPKAPILRANRPEPGPAQPTAGRCGQTHPE